MGKIIIQGSSGGGLDPDEITARASDVLKGKTTIDSDGEVVEGAIERRGTGGENALKIGKNSDSISVSFSAGYYENGNSNDAMPYIKVPYSLLSQTLDIDASKMLENYTVVGVKGAIRVSKTNKNHVKTMNEGFAWSDDRGLMYVIRTDDNYYIPPVSEGGYNYVGVAEPDLKPENIITGKTIGRVKGSIPVKSGTSHNTNGTRGGYNNETQRFYCDIERGAYINNCWSGYPEIGIHRDVFIQNLGIRPEMLRQGYSLFGVQGTLPDYASQQTVFDGASFFGFMRNGAVYNTFKYSEDGLGPRPDSRMMKNWYMIRDGYELMRDGERHTNGAFWCDYYMDNKSVFCRNGFITYNSIPLFLFRKIRITFFVNIYNGNLTRVETHLMFYKKENESMRRIGSAGTDNTPDFDGRSGQLGSYTREFDISNINENCHINFIFEAENWRYSASAYGAINVGKIELIR